MTMTIKKHAEAAARALRAAAPGTHVRTLCADDVEWAIKAHLKQARAARRTHPEAVIITTENGGHVGKSYKYTAHTDHIEITGGYVGDLVITARRKHAQTRSRGEGATLIVRRRMPHQSMGAIVVSR